MAALFALLLVLTFVGNQIAGIQAQESDLKYKALDDGNFVVKFGQGFNSSAHMCPKSVRKVHENTVTADIINSWEQLEKENVPDNSKPPAPVELPKEQDPVANKDHTEDGNYLPYNNVEPGVNNETYGDDGSYRNYNQYDDGYNTAPKQVNNNVDDGHYGHGYKNVDGESDLDIEALINNWNKPAWMQQQAQKNSIRARRHPNQKVDASS